MTHSPRSHPPIPLPDLAQPSPLLYYRLMAFFSCVGGRGLGFLPQALLWAACSVIESPSRRQTARRGPRVTLCFLRLLTGSRPVPEEWHRHLFVPSSESLSPACSYPLLQRLIREATTNSIPLRTARASPLRLSYRSSRRAHEAALQGFNVRSQGPLILGSLHPTRLSTGWGVVQSVLWTGHWALPQDYIH